MWKRFSAWLRCPLCGTPLDLSIQDASERKLADEHRDLADAHGLLSDEFGVFVETGVLTCARCRSWYPVVNGLPIMLPYVTPAHLELARMFDAHIPAGHHPPTGSAVPGERLVMRSFSTEWRSYDYDGVIWEMNYADHEERFLRELGTAGPGLGGPFLELGCGLGITTFLAYKNFQMDAVGVDLSSAAMRATAQYRTNPFLHFVQASVFYLPFQPQGFGVVYSHGVLHHTYSTARAFEALARQCAPGGLLYVWVYGPGSINETLFRRLIYIAEWNMRWLLNRAAPLGAGILPSLALGYLAFNRVRHLKNQRIQTYNYARALHAARDRFTPEFAYRHDASEVRRWFESAGYEAIEVVDWRTMPVPDHADYRRNTGVRGRRAKDQGTTHRRLSGGE